MRVAFDTNSLYTSQAGVARYIRGLLGGLRRLAATDIELREFAWPVENFDFQQPQRAFRTIYRELIWAPFSAPCLLSSAHTDLFHATSAFHIPVPKSIRHVATLYDLAVLQHPERFRRWHRLSAQRQFRHLADGDRIICISRFTADQAHRTLNIPLEKLVPIHLGCDFHPDEPAPVELKPDIELPTEFFLFVGSLEPGKNLNLLREVYRLAEHAGRRLPPLLIIGARWEGVAAEGPPPADWHYLGRQPDSSLVYLYRRALALVFPSKYEGFGLPVVEAMALGCPVICSPVASLPEVGGEAALYAELSVQAYLEAMRRIVQESGLRENLIQKGRGQAAKFSWSRCARETVDVYRQVVN